MKAIDFDGLRFLDELEEIVDQKGLEGIRELIKMKLPLGGHIKMVNQLNHGEEPVYQIDKVSMLALEPESVLWEEGDHSADSIIRTINLPYIQTPFQINIYGSLVDS